MGKAGNSQGTPVKQKLTVAQLQEIVEKQAAHIEILEKSIESRDEKIKELGERMRKIEGEQMAQKSLDFVRDRVTEELKFQLTELQQYTRRYSVVISGLKTGINEKEEIKNIIEKVNSSTKIEDVDKFHRVGPVKEENLQDLIIRFKSHDAKEQFLKKRKNLDRQLKVKPSLTYERRKLLEKARNHLESPETNYEEGTMKHYPEFVYADVHGNLKVCLKDSDNPERKQFLKFNSLKDLSFIIDKKNLQVAPEVASINERYKSYAN